jgi:GTPase SAR1 family protein
MENVPLMLVGNKCDETDARELTAKEGEEQARQWSSHFMETSAKTNYNVKELFQVRLTLHPIDVLYIFYEIDLYVSESIRNDVNPISRWQSNPTIVRPL